MHIRKIIVVFFILTASLVGFSIYYRNTSHQNTTNHIARNHFSDECNTAIDPIFTFPPTDIENIEQLSPPIMQVGSGIKSHSYISTSQPSPVYAPVDSTVVTGAKYTEDHSDASKVQYTLFFDVDCNVSYYYDHLVDVIPEIVEQFPDEPQMNDTRSSSYFSVEIKAGDLIGYSWARQFDFGVLDSRTEPALAQYDEYKNSEKAYAVCPLTFFEEDIKLQLANKVGYFDASDLTVLNNLCE